MRTDKEPPFWAYRVGHAKLFRIDSVEQSVHEMKVYYVGVEINCKKYSFIRPPESAIKIYGKGRNVGFGEHIIRELKEPNDAMDIEEKRNCAKNIFKADPEQFEA